MKKKIAAGVELFIARLLPLVTMIDLPGYWAGLSVRLLCHWLRGKKVRPVGGVGFASLK